MNISAGDLKTDRCFSRYLSQLAGGPGNARTRTSNYRSGFYGALRKIVYEEEWKAAQAAINYLKTHSPKDTGAYAAAWGRKVKESRGNQFETIIVYQKKKPTLTHLLEEGHAKRGGGRASARVHISKARNEAEDRLIDSLTDRLSRELGT